MIKNADIIFTRNEQGEVFGKRHRRRLSTHNNIKNKTSLTHTKPRIWQKIGRKE